MSSQPIQQRSFKERVKGVSLIFACGTALFSDGYANGILGSVNTLLSRDLGPEALASHNYKQIVNSLIFAGTIVGMVLFGYLSDKVGRKFGMMSATVIVALFSALSAGSKGAKGSTGGLFAMLSACRFLLGIGVGAEYPCGSVSASEQSEEDTISKKAQNRWFTLATNSMIDFGFVIAAFVPLVLYWIFRDDQLEAVWRLSLGLGAIPAMLVFVWRLSMEEPARYRRDSMRDAKIPYTLVLRRYWKKLAAISLVWFIYDFIVYPFGIYSSTVIDSVTGGSTSLSVVFGWNVVSNLFYMPGTLCGAFAVDYLGSKNTLIIGLLCQAIVGFLMSGLYSKLKEHIAAFAVMYGIFLSFGEFGPGNNMGLLASKSSPTAIRGQFYGIAAAIGKVGAFVGTWAFPPMIDAFGGPTSEKGNTGPFWVGSGLAVLSALVTYFFIDALEVDGMIKEDAAFRAYLEENGYDTSAMGLKDERESVDIKDEKHDVKVLEKEV